MPTLMGNAFLPSWQGMPPGMSDQDAQIWNRWKKEGLKGAIRMWFNVRVGEGGALPKEVNAREAEWWYLVTAKRIDAVVEYNDYVLLIELRDSAQADVLGRIKTYETLFAKDNPTGKPVQTAVITNKYDAEIEEVAKQMHVNYIVI